MPATVAKSGSLIGPPRNAMLWMRAKEMAQAAGQGGDFQTILQLYQMLTLAPGFAAVTKSKGAADAIDWTPPKGVREACRQGLEWRKEHGGSGLTANTVRWAGKLAAGDRITPERAKAMFAFHARHKGDKQPGWKTGKPTPGAVASQLWGGTSGEAWSAKLRRQIEARKAMYEHQDVKKANMGRKKPGGGRVGAWSWAQSEAKKRGKPKAYAVSLLRRVMGKSLPQLDAALRLNVSERFDPQMYAREISQGNMPKPSRQVASVAEIVSGLPLNADDSAALTQDLGEVLEQAQTPADAMQQAAAACAYHASLQGPLAQDVAQRMAYLTQLTNKAVPTLRLSLRKAACADSMGRL